MKGTIPVGGYGTRVHRPIILVSKLITPVYNKRLGLC